MQVKKRAKKGGLNLILADPRETDLVKNAAVHLKVKPGMDIFWIKALGKIIVEKGWQDQEFCERQTIGFKALCEGLNDFDIDAACNRAGVKRAELEKGGYPFAKERIVKNDEIFFKNMNSVFTKSFINGPISFHKIRNREYQNEELELGDYGCIQIMKS